MHEQRAESEVSLRALWQALRCKCGELSALVIRADDPEKAVGYLLCYLSKHIEDVLGRPLPDRWRLAV